MVPTEKVHEVVGEIGGPPAYINLHRDDLVGTAHHLATLRVESM
jgi:hypothetical protein